MGGHPMSTTDPTIAAFAAHAERVWSLVDQGHLDRHAAMAALVSDALAASTAPSTPPEAADALLHMATTWATVRARALTADALLTQHPIPDTPATLEDTEDTP